jgi:hypothetical protein
VHFGAGMLTSILLVTGMAMSAVEDGVIELGGAELGLLTPPRLIFIL